MRIFFVIFVLVCLPLLAGAQTGADLNPLGHTDLMKFLGAVLDIVIKIGVVLMVVMMVWSGFLYVSAGGNTGKVEKAHKVFMYTVIGSAIILGAYVIINLIQGTINAIK